MENTPVVSPFVVADAYRVGQTDGFRTGIVVGVVACALVHAAFKNRKRDRGWFHKKDN